MASDNLKDFAVDWLMFGILGLCLVSFSIIFIADNSPDALTIGGDPLNAYNRSVYSRLISTEGTSNTLLNISAQTDPTVSDQGSKDSVATSYGLMGTSKGMLNSSLTFFDYVFADSSAKILISVFVGMFGIISLYFITKWIRVGY